MLSNSSLQTIICTSDLAHAKHFYANLLGLNQTGQSDGALIFNVGNNDLRISPVPSHTPSEHTIVGFAVANVENTLIQLTERGISVERFDGFPHQPSGLVITPDGAKVAWFRDPDRNLLSIVEYPVSEQG